MNEEKTQIADGVLASLGADLAGAAGVGAGAAGSSFLQPGPRANEVMTTRVTGRRVTAAR